jgi:hypothetical protein
MHPDEIVGDELVEQRRQSDERALRDQERRQLEGRPKRDRPASVAAGDAQLAPVVEPTNTATPAAGTDARAVRHKLRTAPPDDEPEARDDQAPAANGSEVAAQSAPSTIAAWSTGDSAEGSGSVRDDPSSSVGRSGQLPPKNALRPTGEVLAVVEDLTDELLRVWRKESALAEELYRLRSGVRRLGRRHDFVEATKGNGYRDHSLQLRRTRLRGKGLPGRVEDLLDELVRASTRADDLAEEVARYRECLQRLERRATAAVRPAEQPTSSRGGRWNQQRRGGRRS